MRRPSGLGVVAFALIVFLYAPLAVAVLFAFNGGSNLNWPIHGLSLRWFRAVFDDPGFSEAFFTSLKAAVLTAVISAAIGTAAAFAFIRRPTWPIRVVESLSLLPVMLPPLLIGTSLLAAFTAFNMTTSMATVVLGHLILVIPYVVLVVASRLRGIDLELEQAARDLGAGPVQVLRRITAPLLVPAIAGASLLAFAFSFDEVLITNFTVGVDATLPLYVFSKLRRSVDPSINAVATILLLMPWIALGLALLLARRSGAGRGTGQLTRTARNT